MGQWIPNRSGRLVRKEVSQMRVIGIDPGLDGAAAVIYDDGQRFGYFSFPKHKPKGRGYEPSWPLFPEPMEILAFEADHAFIEKVGSRPKEARSAAFKFGTTAGGIRGIIAMLRVPVTMVTPGAWKLSMRCGGKDKSVSIARAMELFPRDVEYLTTKHSVRNKKQIEGIAEAALIGYYGYQILTKGDHHDVIS